MTTALYAAMCGLFLVFLSLRVIRLRRGHRISIGHSDNAELERAMRVQGNFTEYTPIVLVMLALAELQGLPAWTIHVVGTGFLLARVCHFFGIRSRTSPGHLRVFGMVLTFTVILSLGVILPVQLFMGA